MYLYRSPSPPVNPIGSWLVHLPVPGFCTRYTARFSPVTVSRSIPAKPIIRSPFVGLDSSSTRPEGAVIDVVDDATPSC